MPEDHFKCPFERVAEVQFRSIRAELAEVKERVRALETTLARGVMLLVANLVGVAMSLAQQFAQR